MPEQAWRAGSREQVWRRSVTNAIADDVEAILNRLRADGDTTIADPTTLRTLAEVIDAVASVSSAIELFAQDSPSAATFMTYADLVRLERALWVAQSTRQVRALTAAAEALLACSASTTLAELIEAGDRGVETMTLEATISTDTGAWQVIDPSEIGERRPYDRSRSAATDDAFDRTLISLYRETFNSIIERAGLRERLDTLRQRVTGTPFKPGTGLSALLTPDNAPTAQPTPDRDIAGLTKRELQVLDLLAEGCSSRTIAQRLMISDSTVKTHVKGILRKLDATNRTEAVARWHQLSAS